MQCKHVKTLMPAQDSIARVQAMAWSPNNKRLAVVDAGRFVSLFDEAGERRDKFSSKPADPKTAKTYVVRDIAFSPDSVKLALAQSDYALFVYRLGAEWGEKKSICNKFLQNSAVSCLAWPTSTSNGDVIALGTDEGKVKVAILKTNKAQTLFGHDAAVVSIASALDGNSIVSGHLDGAIFRFTFEGDDGTPASHARIAMHPCEPYCLVWGEHIAAAGSNCVMVFYDRTGKTLHNFDYDSATERDFTCAAVNPSGHTVAVGAADKIRLFNFSLRSRKWEEGNVLSLPNACAFSRLTWKHDGSRLVSGTLTGAVDVFDACLRRYRLRDAFEFTYVSHNQVIVKRLATGTRIALKSSMGYEIQKVNVHQERYLVAHTSTTVLIGDLGTCRLSEVPWQMTGKEKFVFDDPQVCMIFSAGELSLVEYGKNEVLGTCRTEQTNRHRISVRVHDPPEGSTAPRRKCIAYLVDRATVEVIDLVTGLVVAHIPHTTKIDWLELNHRASRLLFRDKQRQLFLYDLLRQTKHTLLNYCSYVQWVPLSDVVVAQNRVELCVWYSIEHPDRVTVVPIKGEVEGIERTGDKTEVVVDEGSTTVAYSLDEYLIEFGTAMEDENYDRACDLLEQIAITPETEAMWRSLSVIALQELKLYIAERCYAALGDVAKAHALHRINQLAEQLSKETSTNGYEHYSVRAELCLLNKEFRKAEQIYLENGQVEKAMGMWEEVQKFSEAIAVGESRGHGDVPAKRAQYFNWLKETGQFEKAGEVREREGKYSEAIGLYLRGGTPARAASVVATQGVKPETQLLEAIASALFKAQIFEKAGDLFEKLGLNDRAVDAYRKGNVYSRAVELAKRAFPQQVTSLEDAWGDYLVAQKLVDQAINHFIEAHQYNKAVTAAISSRQWGKAVNILESQMMGSGNDETVRGYFRQVAQHYEECHQWPDAEKYYIKAGAVNDAVEMYNRAGLADHMYRVAQRHLKQEQIVALFVAQAKQLEARGDYADAERIYIKVDEPDQAILMYKKSRDFTNMIRLVSQYRPDFLLKTHLSLAAGFEKEGNVKLAEQHYVSGKDWGKAVNMYRDRDLWDDAVRVAKVHGGVNASKQVVLTRAINVDAEEGVRLLIKYGLVDAGIESVLESQKFEVALQWSQLAMPAKLPYVHLKQAMHFEDQGEFRLAEEAFVRSGKPREAIDMYVHQHDFDSAMRVAEAHDIGAIPVICSAQARMSFASGNYAEAEQLLLRANQADLLVKFYREASMFDDALRVAKEHAPERVADITRDAARTSSDPVKAGNMLETSGDYPLAIDAYLRATKEHVSDANQLVALWTRAVKLSINHARHLLRDTLRVATAKMTDAGRFVEAGKCLEEGEDFKGAVAVYAKGKKWDLATQLAKRVSPELEDYVKRIRVQMAIDDNSTEGQQDLDGLDPDAAIKAHMATNSWDKVMALTRPRGTEEARRYSAMYVQYLTKEGNIRKGLELIERDGVDPTDIRFFSTWTNFAEAIALALPDATLNVGGFHDIFCDVVANMSKLGQAEDTVRRADAFMHVIHAHLTAEKMHGMEMDDYAVKVVSVLPRYVDFLPADKLYFDAGMAARRYGNDSVAFVLLNRFLDITEKIEDNEPDSSGLDHSDFAKTDFPTSFALPKRPTIAPANYEEANKWVLAISIQNELNPSLPTTMLEGVEVYTGSLRTPKGTTFEACAVTGCPIVQPKLRVKCKQCYRPANQEDWNKYVMQARTCPWCGSQQSPDFKLKE